MNFLGLSDLSHAYTSKPVYFNKPLVATECWYVIIACIMHDYHWYIGVSKLHFNMLRQQKHQRLVCANFHVLQILKTPFPKWYPVKHRPEKICFDFS